MSAYAGSRIYRASKPFRCAHCQQWINEQDHYLRYWGPAAKCRTVVCIVCAIATFNADGERVYECLDLTAFVATRAAALSDEDLVTVLNGAVVAAAIVVNQAHPAIDLMRAFALGIQSGRIEKTIKQQRTPCH